MSDNMAKFNEEICKELIIAHENGLPKNACASIVGINRRTLYDWLKKGEKAKSGKYHDFYLRWLKAEARFQAYHLKKINDSKSWTASQYLLQVTDPETFVIAEKQQVEAQIDQQVQHKGFENLIEAFDASKREWDKHKRE